MSPLVTCKCAKEVWTRAPGGDRLLAVTAHPRVPLRQRVALLLSHEATDPWELLKILILVQAEKQLLAQPR